jgi:hypothetical protein
LAKVYGQTSQLPTFYFRPKDIQDIGEVMHKTKRADTPFEERWPIAYAIALIERKVGDRLRITDRAGMEFGASGDPTQEDCVDEATNTTSFLLILQSHGLLKYHTVGIPFSKGDPAEGHAGGRPGEILAPLDGVIQETKMGQSYAVDSWIYANGENPAVVEVGEMVHQGHR